VMSNPADLEVSFLLSVTSSREAGSFRTHQCIYTYVSGRDTLIFSAPESVSDFCNNCLRFLDLIDSTYPFRVIKELKRQSVPIAMSNSTTATTNPDGSQGTQAVTSVTGFAIGVPVVAVIVFLTVITVLTVFVPSYNLLE
jgi:hypothetical protein